MDMEIGCMEMISSAIPLLLLALVGVLYSSNKFDRLVQAEYEQVREQWIADGEPMGMRWRPIGWVHRGSWLARQRVSFSWLFRTPRWIAESSERVKMLTCYRISVCVLWGVLLILLGEMFFIL
jgi:hypothetical protein